jgi:uncharacterized ferredoxin-like protein
MMGTIEAREAQQRAAMAVASLMAAAARTAPKTRGLDSLQTVILDGEDLEVLATAMEVKGRTKPTKIAIFPRDAQNVRASAAVLLLGVTGEPKRPEVPLDCGACGFATCKEFISTSKDEGQDFRGPLCIYQTLDLGIALGVAAKVSGDLCVDSRIMYTIGAAARQAGYLKGCDVVIGLPLSISGKSPYFDRA